MQLTASWYHLPRWYLCIQAKNSGPRPALTRVGSLATEGGSPSEMRLGCGNLAHRELRDKLLRGGASSPGARALVQDRALVQECILLFF